MNTTMEEQPHQNSSGVVSITARPARWTNTTGRPFGEPFRQRKAHAGYRPPARVGVGRIQEQGSLRTQEVERDCRQAS